MRNVLFKASSLLVVLLFATALLAACGQEKTISDIKPKAKKTISKEAKSKPSIPAEPISPQSTVSEQELSQVDTEVDAAVKEIDQVLSEINQIDISQDNAPNL